MVSTIERFHCIQDSQLGPSGVLYREVPLYLGQPAGSHCIGSASSASACTYVCTSVSTSHVRGVCPHCSVSVIQLMCPLPSQVTEGVQAGPSVGEMSERSRKLEEEIEAMTSQLNATAAS